MGDKMSGAKFASITADLLARKGEGQPWAQGAAREPARIPLTWSSEPHPAMAAGPPPSPPVKDKSCSVHMSPHDYERLGILAIKTGITRQRLLKDALVQFLSAKAQEFSCACLGACERNCGEAG
jgi:predicted transcriptional regulator